MTGTVKWLAGIIVVMVMAYAGIVTDALIDSRETASLVAVLQFRIERLEADGATREARLRHLELGGVHAAPEE